ncbi:polysaccharide biosynthesis/export family protein [Aquabacterium sp.]|uniref:polysaccharide biosynthesis/export family protein n=1 Tax=Aquabacterium sp. TaxID=1872578 RepID=UPI003D6D4788
MKLFVLLLSLCLAACSPLGNLQTSHGSVVNARQLNDSEIARMAKLPTRIYPGDTLRIVRDSQDAVSLDLRNLVEDSQAQIYVVRSDGSFSYRYAGRVEAAGKTPDEVAQLMRSRLEVYYREPGVTVNIVSSPSSKVVIGGSVNAPGPLDMSAVATLEQGIFAAGGFTPTADTRYVALLRLDEQSRYQLYFLDFTRLLLPEDPAAGRPTLAFQRGDVLFVPKSAVGRMGDGVDAYINQLLPFTRSMGLSYSWGETKVK